MKLRTGHRRPAGRFGVRLTAGGAGGGVELAAALFLLLGGIGAVYASPADHRSIRVVMDDNYPPFVFRDSAGELQGLLVDEWRLWENKTGIKAEIAAMDWGEALRRMKAGEFDVIDTVFKTPERAGYWDFSRPYARIDVPIFFQKDIGGITDLKSLRGFPVAAKEGDAATDLLRQNGVTPVLLFADYEAIIEGAKQHKVNVFVMDEPPALYFLNRLGIQGEFRQSAPVNVGEFHRAVKKGNAALLQTVERGFAAISPAELKRLEQKWHGYPLGDRRYLRQLGYAAGAVVLLVAGLMAWSLSLNRLVRLRTAALRESEQKFRSIFQNAPVAIFQSTLPGRLLSVNAAGVQMFGYDSPEDFLATATDMGRQLFVRPEDRQKIVAEALGCERFVRHEVEYRRKDNSVFLANLSMRAVRDAGGEVGLVEGFVEDITLRKQAEEELHRLSAHLLQVQDQERRRLARELHDTTAQYLAALSLNLGNLKRRLAKNPESGQALCGECVDLANRAAQEIRTQAYLLHPPMLEVLGLAGAVEEYAQGFAARCGIAVELEAPSNFGRLPDDMELALFRVVQESLANVLRHSGSARARIRFTRQDAIATLEIQDMGQGIPAEKLARIRSLSGGFGVGLGGMQERLRRLGGRLDIESGPSGTTVRATVPLAGVTPESGPIPAPAAPGSPLPVSNAQAPVVPP